VTDGFHIKNGFHGLEEFRRQHSWFLRLFCLVISLTALLNIPGFHALPKSLPIFLLLWRSRPPH
jgi:hypothetical protein